MRALSFLKNTRILSTPSRRILSAPSIGSPERRERREAAGQEQRHNQKADQKTAFGEFARAPSGKEVDEYSRSPLEEDHHENDDHIHRSEESPRFCRFHLFFRRRGGLDRDESVRGAYEESACPGEWQGEFQRYGTH